VLALSSAVIITTLLIFYLVEFLAWIPLQATHEILRKRRRPAKTVNRPVLGWKL
jgi:hypothetical protein